MSAEQQNSSQDSFLVPDLCSGRPFILLLMATQLLVIVFMLFEYGLQFDWMHMGSITVYMQWQSIVSALVLALLGRWLGNVNKNLGASITFLVLIGLGALIAILAQKFNDPTSLAIDWLNVGRNTSLSAIVVGVALRYLYLQQQLLDREKAQLQASLVALQARIKPHFLFNTMNSIASLISIEPEKAEKMVEDLATLLRASLREGAVETTIENEWELCQRYLEIEQLRLGDRLSWECDLQGLDAISIPSLCLQPLIENAIYHGIQVAPEKGYIHIHGEMQHGRLLITVENSIYPQYKSERYNKGNKMAIDNIRHRIQHLYGESAQLKLEDKGDKFVASLSYKPVGK